MSEKKEESRGTAGYLLTVATPDETAQEWAIIYLAERHLFLARSAGAWVSESHPESETGF